MDKNGLIFVSLYINYKQINLIVMYKLVNKVGGLDVEITDDMYAQSGENIRQHYERAGDDAKPKKLTKAEKEYQDAQAPVDVKPSVASEATVEQHEEHAAHDQEDVKKA